MKSILKLTELIQDEGIRIMTKLFIDDKVNPETFNRGASSSKKYHPYECRFTGGLKMHTRYVVNSALVLMDANPYYDSHPINRDRIISACILHDAFKYGYPILEGHTTRDHNETCYNLMIQWMKDHKLVRADKVNWIKTAELVRSHHGKWGNYPTNTMDKQLVHEADMIASRLHIIRMEPEYVNGQFLDENSINIINNYISESDKEGLTPEVVMHAMKAHYLDPSLTPTEYFSIGYNEWIK